MGAARDGPCGWCDASQRHVVNCNDRQQVYNSIVLGGRPIATVVEGIPGNYGN